MSKDTADSYGFSSKHINQRITAPLDSVTRVVARHFAAIYRKEDIEKHIPFFRLQSVGEQVDVYNVEY